LQSFSAPALRNVNVLVRGLLNVQKVMQIDDGGVNPFEDVKAVGKILDRIE